MALSVHTDDLQNADAKETVAYTKVRPSGNTTISSVTALRRALDNRAVQFFSGFGVDASDILWHIPTDQVDLVQSDDQITTGTGEIWIVKASQKQTLSNRWRILATRKP